jgi:protein-tyrosine phosphatase
VHDGRPGILGGEPGWHTLRCLVDLHCHILPGIDDGPRTIDDSVALARAAYEAGTRTIAATSHVNWDYPDVDAAVIHGGVVAVNAALREAEIDLRVVPGAEIALARAAELSDADLGVLRLGSGKHLMVEFPGSAAGFEHALGALAGRGHGILLAHPERSSVLQRRPELVRRLVDSGLLYCVSAESLNGENGRGAMALAWMMLAEGLAHVLASDAHDTVTRPPDLRAQLERAGLDSAQIDHLARAVPQAIVQGTPLPPPLAVTRHRRLRRPPGGRRRSPLQ